MPPISCPNASPSTPTWSLRSSAHRILPAASQLVLLCSILGAALQAAPTDPGIPDLSTRGTAQAWHKQWWPQSSGAALGYTGNAAAGLSGSLSLAFREQALLRYNLIRRMAGSEPLMLDEDANQKAQLAAMLMSANKALNYDPPSDWLGYSLEAASAVGDCNLVIDANHPTAALDMLRDPGEENVRVLSHREWLLAPWMGPYVGIGDAPATATTSAAAALALSTPDLAEVDARSARFKAPVVHWPAPGFIPHYLIPGQWSLFLPDGIGHATTPASTLTLRDIEVIVTLNGTALPVSLTTTASGFSAVWTLDNTLEGDTDLATYALPGGERIQARPNGSKDLVYHVRVEGLRHRVPDPTKPDDGGSDLGTGALYNGDGVYEYDVTAYNPELSTNLNLTAQPRSQALPEGSQTLLFAAADAAVSYQWFRDGLILNGATQGYYPINALSDADLGRYHVLAYDSAGNATTSLHATLTRGVAQPDKRKLANISTRATVGTGDNVQIAGFVINGTKPKTVLIRAGGPSIKNSLNSETDYPGALANPTLELYKGGKAFLSNDDWDDTPARGDLIETVANGLGAYRFTRGSKDAALLVTLEPGAYSAIVRGKNDSVGACLVEVYDASLTQENQLMNISTRAQVLTGDEIEIGGFVIEGDRPRTVLIRGLGPGLLKAAPSLQGTLADPKITVYKGPTAIANNDNWSADAVKADLLASTASRIGASELNRGSKDAALLLTLEPGGYSVHVAGVGDTRGIGMVEVYDVP